MLKVTSLFDIDGLSLIMLALIGFVGIVIAIFSSRYLTGDTRYKSFFLFFGLLLLGLLLAVLADHLLLFFIGWATANLALWRLMVHKPTWPAALAAGRIAFKNFLLGIFFVGSSFLLFFYFTGETSLRALDQYHVAQPGMVLALLLLFLGAMAQSAIWPFSQWLGSSLNSPTPVSALMHAGMINGGGFLLARFAPLYLHNSILLPFIFGVGAVTTVLGILWKLMQPDVKRMLAFSTMGQMGFMVMQCGLGLFPAAVAHLCWHGLFKAYLFLSSGSVAQDKRQKTDYPPTITALIVALLGGLVSSFSFTQGEHQAWLEPNTHLVLTMVAMIGGIQLSLVFWGYFAGEQKKGCSNCFIEKLFKNSLALLTTWSVIGFIGFLYGSSIHFFERILAPLHILEPQPLSTVYIIGMLLLLLPWILFLFAPSLFFLPTEGGGRVPSPWLVRAYVFFLNRSQPAPATVTALHKSYHCFEKNFSQNIES